MFCSNCGAQNPEGSIFCASCGSPLQGNANTVVHPYPNPTAGIAQQAPRPQAQQQYERGCFGSAWRDVAGSKGMLLKLVLLTLISFVPILNFVVLGYAFNWAKDPIIGKNDPLPKGIVTSANFKIGFFIFVIGCIAEIVLFFETVILAVIPIVGFFAGIVLYFFFYSFAILAFLRVALHGSIGEGFAVGKIMDAFKRKTSSMVGVIGLSFLISLVAGLILGSIIYLIVYFLYGTGDALVQMAYSNYSSGNAQALSGARGWVLALTSIFTTCLVMALSNLLLLVVARGAGYYVVRYAPEWASAFAGSYAYSGQAAVSNATSQDNQVYSQQQDERIAEQEFQKQANSVTQYQSAPNSSVRKVPYDYDHAETSVLSDIPEELDTTVQPEETSVLISDDSETSVLGHDGGVRMDPVVQQTARVEKTIQFIRANGDTCTLSAFPVTIGKGSEADLVIEGNGAISRLHARVLRDGDVFAVEDLSSTNKTYINGFELVAHAPTIISDGDELRLANEILQVKVI